MLLFKNFIFCFILKEKENSNSTTIIDGIVQEADSLLPPRHRKRSRSVKITSSISTGNKKCPLLFHFKERRLAKNWVN